MSDNEVDRMIKEASKLHQLTYSVSRLYNFIFDYFIEDQRFYVATEFFQVYKKNQT